MSWDIFIQDLPAVGTIEEIPSDFRPKPIGNREEMITRILEAVPFAERQDEDWMFVRTGEVELSMSFNLDEATRELMCVMIHVHGGAYAAACVAAIVRASGQRALDTGTGGFFDLRDPDVGYEKWAAYRDHVINSR
jgi:hypothetical protein